MAAPTHFAFPIPVILLDLRLLSCLNPGVAFVLTQYLVSRGADTSTELRCRQALFLSPWPDGIVQAFRRYQGTHSGEFEADQIMNMFCAL